MTIDKKNTDGSTEQDDIKLEDAIAQSEPADSEPEAKPANKNLNKKIAKIMDIAKAEKKSLIQIAALIIGVIAVAGLARAVVYDADSSLFRGSLKQANAEYNKLINDIDIFKKTNPFYTGVNTPEAEEQQKDINWIGVKYDAGRVKADTQYFWDWISPAFDYNSATEYNSAIAEFTSTKGLKPDNLFVTTFLQYYDYTSVEHADADGDGKATPNEIQMCDRNYKCYTSKSVYADWVRLIGTTESGDYHYMSMVPMAASDSSKYYTMVLFTFTAKHTVNPVTNSDTISITDFNVWPPHSRKPTRIER